MATKKQTVQTFHPAKASRITDTFGTHSELRKKLGLGAHRGVDYSVQEGTPLVAVGTGRIKNIGSTKILGNFIEISAPVVIKGKVVVKIFGYYHLRDDQSTRWTVGDPVKGGELLCHAGNTGTASSGAHLHFMAGDKINLATSPVEDPLPLIQSALTPVTVEVQIKEPSEEPTKKPAAKKPAKK